MIAADLRLDNRDELPAALGLDPERAKSTAGFRARARGLGALGRRRLGPAARAVRGGDLEPARARAHARPRSDGPQRGRMASRPDLFAFATLPKGLFALPDVPRELNEEKLADFLVLNHAEHETTFYRDVFRLPPAHVAAIDASGTMTMRRYWSADDIEPVRLGSTRPTPRPCASTSTAPSVGNCAAPMRSAAFFRGGLDSSSVAALAARALAGTGQAPARLYPGAAQGLQRAQSPAAGMPTRPPMWRRSARRSERSTSPTSTTPNATISPSWKASFTPPTCRCAIRPIVGLGHPDRPHGPRQPTSVCCCAAISATPPSAGTAGDRRWTTWRAGRLIDRVSGVAPVLPRDAVLALDRVPQAVHRPAGARAAGGVGRPPSPSGPHRPVAGPCGHSPRVRRRHARRGARPPRRPRLFSIARWAAGGSGSPC